MHGREVIRERNPLLGVRQHAATVTFATQVELAMRDRGIRKKDLAAIIGKTRAWISKVLHGPRNLTFFTAVELADAIGYDLDIKVVPRDFMQVEFPFVRGNCSVFTMSAGAAITLPSPSSAAVLSRYSTPRTAIFQRAN